MNSVNTTPALAVAELTVDYGGVRALDDVTFTVAPGEIVGLIGPNGAGKTTCIDAITGFATARTGRVMLGQTNLGESAPHRIAAAGLSRTFQSLELFDDLSVADNVAVGLATVAPAAVWTDVFGRGRRREVAPAVRDMLDHLGLSDVADRRPDALSNGARHLVAMGRALVSQPKVVCLDEPAAGLDTTETEGLATVIAGLVDLGTSVLLVDHDMDLVFGTCHKVVALDFGHVIASGTPAEVRRNALVREAYLGTLHPGSTGGQS